MVLEGGVWSEEQKQDSHFYDLVLRTRRNEGEALRADPRLSSPVVCSLAALALLHISTLTSALTTNARATVDMDDAHLNSPRSVANRLAPLVTQLGTAFSRKGLARDDCIAIASSMENIVEDLRALQSNDEQEQVRRAQVRRARFVVADTF